MFLIWSLGGQVVYVFNWSLGGQVVYVFNWSLGGQSGLCS